MILHLDRLNSILLHTLHDKDQLWGRQLFCKFRRRVLKRVWYQVWKQKVRKYRDERERRRRSIRVKRWKAKKNVAINRSQQREQRRQIFVSTIQHTTLNRSKRDNRYQETTCFKQRPNPTEGRAETAGPIVKYARSAIYSVGETEDVKISSQMYIYKLSPPPNYPDFSQSTNVKYTSWPQHTGLRPANKALPTAACSLAEKTRKSEASTCSMTG